MTDLSRRVFLKGAVAAALTTSLIKGLFVEPVGAALLPKNNEMDSSTVLFRHAISLGRGDKITNEKIQDAKVALIRWVKLRSRHRVLLNDETVRFTYMIDDFGNECGIGCSVYPRSRLDVGMTWGQMANHLRAELGLR